MTLSLLFPDDHILQTHLVAPEPILHHLTHPGRGKSRRVRGRPRRFRIAERGHSSRSRLWRVSTPRRFHWSIRWLLHSQVGTRRVLRVAPIGPNDVWGGGGGRREGEWTQLRASYRAVDRLSTFLYLGQLSALYLKRGAYQVCRLTV